MKTGTFFRQAAKILAFLVLVTGIGVTAGHILNTNVRSFDRTDTKKADGAQVLFFGTSQGANGVNPLMLWDEAGIPAYNFCGVGQYIGTTYYVMKDVLDRRSPEVAVLDMESLIRPDDFLTISNKLYSLPVIADLGIRFEMYRDIIGEEPVYMIPFFRYHNRWKEITRNDSRREYYVLGCSYRAEVQSDFGALPEEFLPEAEPVGEREAAYLEDILALAGERGVTLAPLDMPCYSSEENEAKTQWVREWAEEHGVPIFEGNRPEAYEACGLTPADFCDDMHLNVSGQEKFSASLARWLSGTFGLDDLRGTQAGLLWEENIKTDRALQADRHVLTASTLDGLLAALTDGDYTVAISLQGEYRQGDSAFFPALERFGMSREAYEAGGSFVWRRPGEWQFASQGSLSYLWTEQLDHDDLVLRGTARRDENGALIPHAELIMDRSDQSKTSDGVNFLIYSHSQKTMLRAVGFDVQGDLQY